MSEKQNFNNYIIRDFVTKDYHSITELWETIGLGGAHRGDTLQIIEQTLAHGGRFLIMEYMPENKLIGTAWLTNDFRRLYLHHFGISIEFQGLGLSKQLCNACIQIGKGLNLQMKLEVNRENFRAINLYLKNGFKELGDYEVLIIRNYE
jgi:ribosomal protein S18 acetylase RimI-like enzyme